MLNCTDCGAESEPVIVIDEGYWSEAWGARQWHPPEQYQVSECCEARLVSYPLDVIE